MKRVLLVMTVVEILVSCGKGNGEGESAGLVALRLSGGIEVAGRATGEVWELGDAIGVYMVEAGGASVVDGASNREYVTVAGDGSFATTEENTVYFPSDWRAVDVVAYYPRQVSLADGMLELDMQNQSSVLAPDLMTARASSATGKLQDKDHPVVALEFAHRLTRLELTIEVGTGMDATALEGIAVELTRQRVSGSYDPLFEVLGVDEEPVEAVKLCVTANGTRAVAILLPTTSVDGINPVIAGRELLFMLATGEVLHWAVPDEKSFNCGERNLYTIRVNRASIEVTSKIIPWTPGNGEGKSGEAE